MKLRIAIPAYVNKPRVNKPEAPKPDAFADPGPGKFPYDLAAYLAGDACSVYNPGPKVLEYLKEPNYTDARFFDQSDIQAVGYVHRGYKILVFRGTDSRIKWGYNLRMCKSGDPSRHRGFQQAWEAVAPEIATWIASIASPGALILSGHSLGGALATLAAFELSARTPIHAIITFGAPRVGGRAFRDAYRQRAAAPHATSSPTLESITWRVVHSTDLFPDVPPPLLFYRHVGHQIFVKRNGFFASGRLDRVETTGSPILIRAFRFFPTVPQQRIGMYGNGKPGDSSSFEIGSEYEGYITTLGLIAFSGASRSAAILYGLIQLARGVWTDIARHSAERYCYCLPPRESISDPLIHWYGEEESAAGSSRPVRP